MDVKTLEALKGSIAKWEGIVAGKRLDGGVRDCPLCEMFYLKSSTGCLNCPVAIVAKDDGCRNTPYVDEWMTVGGIARTADTPARKNAALAELEFLKSLLPNDTVPAASPALGEDDLAKHIVDWYESAGRPYLSFPETSLALARSILTRAPTDKVRELEAEVARLKDELHYANGTCGLAMKHRDESEAALAEALTLLKFIRNGIAKKENKGRIHYFSATARRTRG